MALNEDCLATIFRMCFNDDGTCPINVRLAGGFRLRSVKGKTMVRECAAAPWFEEEAALAHILDRDRLRAARARCYASVGVVHGTGDPETVLKGFIDGGFQSKFADLFAEVKSGRIHLHELAHERVFMHALARGATYAMLRFPSDCPVSADAIAASEDPAGVIQWILMNIGERHPFWAQYSNAVWYASFDCLSVEQITALLPRDHHRFQLAITCALVRQNHPLREADLDWQHGFQLTSAVMEQLLKQLLKSPSHLILASSVIDSYEARVGRSVNAIARYANVRVIDGLFPHPDEIQLLRIFEGGVRRVDRDMVDWCLERGLRPQPDIYYSCRTQSELQLLRGLSVPFPAWPRHLVPEDSVNSLGAAYLSEAPDVPRYSVPFIVNVTMQLKDSALPLYQRATAKGFQWDRVHDDRLAVRLFTTGDSAAIRWIVERGFPVTRTVKQIALCAEISWMSDWLGQFRDAST